MPGILLDSPSACRRAHAAAGRGAGSTFFYLQPSLAGREARPGSVLATAGCQTPCPEARVRWGQGRRRSWSCCWPLAGVPPGEGVSGGQGAQASWDCGAVAPRQVSGPGSPAPLVFPVGVREWQRPGPGQHSGQWPRGEVRAAHALPGAGAQSPCLRPQVWLRLALLGLSFLGDRGESPGRRPAALEPRPLPSGQAAAPLGWVFPSREAGLRPHAFRSLQGLSWALTTSSFSSRLHPREICVGSLPSPPFFFF